MKRSIYTLTAITLAISGLAFADIITAKPAMAQGARFVFEPNKWKVDNHEKPSGRYLNQIRNPQPATAVTTGSMPHGNALLGVDPTFLAPAPPPPIVRTAVKPTIMAPRAVPALKPTPFNPSFGSPVQPQQPAMLAQQPPGQFGSPNSNNARPSGSTSQGLHGKLHAPRQPIGHVAHLSGRLHPPAQPKSAVAEPKVISYNNNAYKQGSTAPKSYSTGFGSSSNVSGVILHK